MTTTTIRKILLDYLANAEDDKVKAIYTLLKDDIDAENSFKLTEEQYQILERQRELYLSGEVKPYTREEAMQFIRRK